MVIIDKAAWQIGGGIPEDLVISHFNTVFTWLDDHKMLSAEGKEELEKIYKKYREFENFYGVGRTRIWLPDPTRISEFFGKGRV